MNAPARITVFAALLVGVFTGAAALGNGLDPSGPAPDAGHGAQHEQTSAGHGTDMNAEESGADMNGEKTTVAAPPPPGLQVAQSGYRLVLDCVMLAGGSRDEPFGFRILDAAGRPVRDFEVEHDKRMHFIVVRRDLAGFQHLHPSMSPDGTWSARVNLAEGGTYRVFADFMSEGKKLTLGSDVQVGGSFRPQALPRPAQTVRSDGGLEVSLSSQGAQAEREGRLEFEVRHDGRPIDDRLQPYLGAKGHLVALRQGDLAYLHTHPEGDELAFMTTYPSAGTYRLFVQFQVAGTVHTAAFTREVSS